MMMYRTMKLAILLAGPLVTWAALQVGVVGGEPEVAAPSDAPNRNEMATGCAIFGAQNTRGMAGADRACQRCHVNGNATPVPGFPQAAEDLWVQLNEVLTYAQKDKHFQAYAVLKLEKAEAMARLLSRSESWQDVFQDGQSQIHRDKRCLACHSGVPVHLLEPVDASLVDDALTTNFKLTTGVGCEGCHGPAADSPQLDANGVTVQPGWLKPHYAGDRWRGLSAVEKQEQYGFYDLRSPIARTRLCVSCHVGNVEQGKIVTHEMFAAGHPPLPGLEVASFLLQQPQHWQELSEKTEAVREAIIRARGKDYDTSELPKTKAMLIAALVTQSESFRLVSALSDERHGCPDTIPKPDWPELSQFACYACHHELRRDSWRQARGFRLTPGRPVLHEWPGVLTSVALQFLQVDPKDLSEQLAPSVAALSAQPFGEPARLAGTTARFSRWLEQHAEKLAARHFVRGDGRPLLRVICEVATAEPVDYESARQLAWAFAIVYRELTGRTHGHGTREVLRWYRDAEGKRLDDLDPVEAALADLDQILLLELRAGEQEEPATLQLAGTKREVFPADLTQILPAIASYDPSAFQQQFRLIRARLVAAGGGE